MGKKNIMKKECRLCRYMWNILIAIDQLANVILGGDPDETISSRAGKRQEEQLWAKWLCKFLNIFENEHCKISIEEDEGDKSALDD